ncbi:MAG TPA: hypothetical protein VF518_09700 [Polyangia bacterium]
MCNFATTPIEGAEPAHSGTASADSGVASDGAGCLDGSFAGAAIAAEIGWLRAGSTGTEASALSLPSIDTSNSAEAGAGAAGGACGAAAGSGGGGTMVGAMANSEVEVRRLAAAPTDPDDVGASLTGPEGGDGAGASGLGAEAAGPGATGLTAAGSPGRKGVAAGGIGRPGMPGTGPPVHIRVLAGPALLAPPLPAPAMKMGFPQAWQKLTGRAAPGLGAGSGDWQWGQFDSVIWRVVLIVVD